MCSYMWNVSLWACGCGCVSAVVWSMYWTNHTISLQRALSEIKNRHKNHLRDQCLQSVGTIIDGDPIEKQGHLDRGLGTSSREWPPGLPRVVDLLAFWYPVTTPQPWTLNGWVAFGSWHEVRIFLDFQGILCCIPVMSAVEARRDLEVEDYHDVI